MSAIIASEIPLLFSSVLDDPKNNMKLENRLQSKAIVFASQKQSVPEGKKYSLLTAEVKYRRDILCGAELCALHL